MSCFMYTIIYGSFTRNFLTWFRSPGNIFHARQFQDTHNSKTGGVGSGYSRLSALFISHFSIEICVSEGPEVPEAHSSLLKVISAGISFNSLGRIHFQFQLKHACG